MQKEMLSSTEAQYRNNYFARRKRQSKCHYGRKNENSFFTLKTPILKAKSELIFKEEPTKLLNFLYPIGKHYIKDDVPNMNIYDFNHYLLKEITKDLEIWKISENDDGDFELWIAQDNTTNYNGFCSELYWIMGLKKDWQNFIWEYFSYLVQHFHIPFLHGMDYIVDICEDYINDWVEDLDKDEIKKAFETIKFYKKTVMPLEQKINFQKSNHTEESLKKMLSKIKINNYKDQKILAWIEEGFEIITEDFNNYIPHKTIINEDDDFLFGPEYYANLLWNVDETDPVFNRYEEQADSYYQNYDILPFYKECQITAENPFNNNEKDEFPENYKNWLASMYLIYEQ